MRGYAYARVASCMSGYSKAAPLLPRGLVEIRGKYLFAEERPALLQCDVPMPDLGQLCEPKAPF